MLPRIQVFWDVALLSLGQWFLTAKDRIAIKFKLPHPDDEGTTIVWNVRKYWPDRTTHTRKLEFFTQYFVVPNINETENILDSQNLRNLIH